MSDLNALRNRFLTAVAGNEVAAAVACYHEDAVLIAPEGRYEGRDYIEAYYRIQFEAFPDAGLTVVATYDAGDTAVGEWTFSGTNTGPLELPGGEVIPPTRRRFTQRGMDVASVDGGLIREHRLYYDQLELIEQLGLQVAPLG